MQEEKGKREKEKGKISACGRISYRFLYFLLDNCTDVQYISLDASLKLQVSRRN